MSAGPAEIREWNALPDAELFALARETADRVHGRKVLLRGLVEVSSECAMNCLYCGIRRDNRAARRYRLSAGTLTATVRAGLRAGFRTFVLQGGEADYLRGEGLLRLVETARASAGEGPAITLSFGIRSRSEYTELRAAGADRYLMRFETADPDLHRRLRAGIPLKRRLRALEDIRAAGLQLGSGFMTGLPGEPSDALVRNVELAAKLDMDMGGAGPFIPHPDTPLGDHPGGRLETALRATALLRLALPRCHIPATTAAGSIHPEGREMMLRAGANVLMPNISPEAARQRYLLYPGKVCLSESGFAAPDGFSARMAGDGLEVSWERGDALAAREVV